VLLYAITDRAQLRRPLFDCIHGWLAAGIDYIQIREKDLPARALYELVAAAVALPNPHGTRILVNERVDVALAAGAHGVHLPSHALSPQRIRTIVPPGFVIGVSCHAAIEVEAAEREGADFAVFGPVFETASKRGYGPPAGVAALEAAVRGRRLPVFALGGITLDNFQECRAAAGLAAVSLFQNAPDPEAVVRRLRLSLRRAGDAQFFGE
jgi:thiamine-phosphate pyrophosphorylase